MPAGERVLARADAPANINHMVSVIEFRPRRDDTVWAVVASIGRQTRVAEIFPSRERALADQAWREQQVRAYASLFQSQRQPAPLYTVSAMRFQDLPRTWTPLPALGFLRGNFI